MDDFDVAGAAAYSLACRLAVEGHDPGVIADAFVATALALFAAHHSMPETARGLAMGWSKLRRDVDHG